MALLGRTANGLFWMFRYIERAENMARLVDAGQRISLTNLSGETDEWESILVAAGVEDAYRRKYDAFDADTIIDFLVRDQDNPSSIRSSIDTARMNGRMVRTALTRDLWESINESYLAIRAAFGPKITQQRLPKALDIVKNRCAVIRGTFHGTMLRNEIFDFCNLGAYLERADNTARILDVKYYVLLPSVAWVGSSLDNVQWDTLLRSVAGNRAYSWLNAGSMDPRSIAAFLILDGQFPRSLVFCYDKIRSNMAGLAKQYGGEGEAHLLLRDAGSKLHQTDIEQIFDKGLHEFLTEFIATTNEIAGQIAADYRFIE